MGLPTDADLSLAVSGGANGAWAVGIRNASGLQIVEHPAIYTGARMIERHRKAVASLTVKGWVAMLTDLLN